MKPKELKIGDLVQVSKGCILPKGTICKVIAVNESYFMENSLVSVATIDEGNERLLFYEEIEEIPLTVEILQKNGWAKGEYGLWEKGRIEIEQCNETEFMYCKGDLKVVFLYVHSLQHFLFGLGIDDNMEV